MRLFSEATAHYEVVDDGEESCGLEFMPCMNGGIRASFGEWRCWEAALPLEDPMFQVDPLEKAADCERALRIVIDPVHRENLTYIREFWISLANERRFLTEHEFAKQAEAIGRLHANLSAPPPIH